MDALAGLVSPLGSPKRSGKKCWNLATFLGLLFTARSHTRFMKTHHTLLWTVLLSTCWLAWRQSHPTQLQLFTGRPDPRVIELLRIGGADFQVTQRGLKLTCDQAGFECIYDVMRFHQQAADLCTQNLANAQTTRTEDGTPYRRRFLCMSAEGKPVVEIDRGDFNWIYDPKNPNAVQEGDHKGYVASPNVNALLELSLLRQHQQMTENYQAVLCKFEASHPDLVIFKCQVDLPTDRELRSDSPQAE